MNHYDTPIIIAAAGMGKRLGMHIPKSLVSIAGKRIIDYQLDLLKNYTSIHMVIGFHSEEVESYVRKIRNDVTFHVNNNYKNTATLYSLSLASKKFTSSCICIDGDMIIDRNSFNAFVDVCKSSKALIGVSSTISDDPVYALIDEQHKTSVIGFSRTVASSFEWANIAYVPSAWLEHGLQNPKDPVFTMLEAHLPIGFTQIDRLEVDTAEDLAFAEKNILHLQL